MEHVQESYGIFFLSYLFLYSKQDLKEHFGAKHIVVFAP